ncbi:MAG: DUF2508 family protein [Oscillospiraceae bacterium]|nr:DUF2508 family protein [Oscillospiraceae bacterium]
MAEASRTLFRRTDRELAEERRDLLEGMRQTKLSINQAYAGFNFTEDPDLIESYVYEINALQARYSYLLRRVRALGE